MAMGRVGGRLLGFVGIIIAMLAVMRVGDPTQTIGFGIVLSIVWFLSPPIAFGAAHLGLLSLPGIETVLDLLFIEVGLSIALIGPWIRRGIAARLLVGTAAATIGLLGVFWIGLGRTGSVAGVAAMILGVWVTVVYLIDRYERIRLGKLEPRVDRG